MCRRSARSERRTGEARRSPSTYFCWDLVDVAGLTFVTTMLPVALVTTRTLPLAAVRLRPRAERRRDNREAETTVPVLVALAVVAAVPVVVVDVPVPVPGRMVLPVGVPRRAVELTAAAFTFEDDTAPDDTVGLNEVPDDAAIELVVPFMTLGPDANAPGVTGSAAVVGLAAVVLVLKTAAEVGLAAVVGVATVPALLVAAAPKFEDAAVNAAAADVTLAPVVPPTVTALVVPDTTPDAAEPSPAPLRMAGVAGELMDELTVTCGLVCRAGQVN
jgi:hypothetical protein